MAEPGGIRIGWTGKLPCRGDFVTGGARLGVFSWFDDWAAEGIVAVRDGGGPAADRFLTSDLRRIAAAAGVLGPASVLAVIGPGMDRAARLFPFLIAAEVSVNIDPARTLQAAMGWFGQIEEAFLDALAPDFQPDRMDGILAAVPGPNLTLGDGRGMAHAVLDATPTPLSGAPAFGAMFGGASIASSAAAGPA